MFLFTFVFKFMIYSKIKTHLRYKSKADERTHAYKI